MLHFEQGASKMVIAASGVGEVAQTIASVFRPSTTSIIVNRAARR
jgi:hypothetical protein